MKLINKLAQWSSQTVVLTFLASCVTRTSAQYDQIAITCRSRQWPVVELLYPRWRRASFVRQKSSMHRCSPSLLPVAYSSGIWESATESGRCADKQFTLIETKCSDLIAKRLAGVWHGVGRGTCELEAQVHKWWRVSTETKKRTRLSIAIQYDIWLSIVYTT